MIGSRKIRRKFRIPDLFRNRAGADETAGKHRPPQVPKPPAAATPGLLAPKCQTGRKCQTACKPGSVRRFPVARKAAGRPFLWDAPRDAPHATNPGSGAGMPLVPATPAHRGTGRPYSVLLPVGFTLPPPLPGARCALAAPFHPCPLRPARHAGGTGGLFSVALSLGSPPPAVGRHRIPVEPGLSSTARRRGSAGSSGRPAVWRDGDGPAPQAGQAAVPPATPRVIGSIDR